MLVDGGVLASGNWKQALRPGASECEAAQLLGVAGSYTYQRVQGEHIKLQVEGAFIKHFGLQEHVEFTVVPVAARWDRFPGQDDVRTSRGIGAALS